MISVVMCTYNGGKFIQEQLQSILDQTLLPDEVLILDDGSTDDTEQICCDFIDKNKLFNWTFKRNSQNLGWANNFMNGFHKAQGDIIFPCDQDDIWEPDKIEKMSSILIKNPNIALLVGNYRKMIQDGENIKLEKLKPFTEEIRPIPFDEKMLFIDYPGCVYAFRKQFLETIVPYSFDSYPHDALLIRMARMMGMAYVYDKPVIKFRRHGNNASGKPIRTISDMVERIQYYIHCLEEMKHFCDEHEGYDDKKVLIEKNIKFYNTRLDAFEHRKIVGKNSLLSCAKYLQFYPEPRSFLGDIYRILH